MHGLDYREGEELSWCPCWSNSVWQGWSCGLVYCPGGNATDPIWRVLASSDGISSWTPLKPQHSNPNPFGQSTVVYWLPYSSHTSHHPSPTSCLHWISYATQKLMIDSCQMVEKQSEAFYMFLWHHFQFKNRMFIAYRSSKVSSSPVCIFEVHQLWQPGFSRVYSNSCCSCSFEAEIIKTGQSSHKMYSNDILNFHESTTILDARTKKSGNLLKVPCTYQQDNEFQFEKPANPTKQLL